MKRKVIVGASLLAVGVVMATTAAIIEKPGTVVWDNGISYQKTTDMKETNLSNQLPKDTSVIKKIKIESNSKNVYIQRGNQFSVTETHVDSKDKAQVAYSNGELNVKATTGVRRILSFDLDDSDVRMPRIIITVPETSKIDTIDVTQSDSEVTLSDLNTENLTVKSDNDDVNLTRVISKNIILDVQNGEANLHNLTADNLQVGLENDDLTLAGSTIKTLKADLQNGDAELEHSKIETGGYLRNENGDISIETTQLPTFSAHTENGETEISPTVPGQQSGQVAFVIQNENGDIEIE